MFAVEGKTIKEIDKMAMEEYGIPSLVLMENAALRVVEFMQKHINLTSQMVCIIAGKGNNGGDGIAVFRHLWNLGYQPYLIMANAPEKLSPDAMKQYKMVDMMQVDPSHLIFSDQKEDILDCMEEADVLLDALFGTGFNGRMPDELWEIYANYNDSSSTKIALDIPSGLDSNTGLGDTVMESEYTVTVGVPKIGLFLDERKRAGTVFLGSISLPDALLSRFDTRYRILTASEISGIIGKRKPQLHKGEAGKILLVGGKKGMTGAVYLSAEGAVRSGAGLVSCIVPEEVNEILEQKLTEAMTIPLKGTDGCLCEDLADMILKECSLRDVLIVGPGLGRHEASTGLVKRLISESIIPLVVDADALFHLASIWPEEVKRRSPMVITPHEGEAARLLGWSACEVKDNRIGAIEALQGRYGGVVLLKGSRTLIYDGEELAINSTGNPGMATGGSGDVLSGIIGALMGQGLDAFMAAKTGAYLHGLAGDLAAQEWGEESMKAGDITSYIAKAFMSVKKVCETHTFLTKIV
jgi:NAD(P)H-hydrate epimerase